MSSLGAGGGGGGGAAVGIPDGTSSSSAATYRAYAIQKESELRIEVSEIGPAFLKLLSGTAEVFGVELVEGKTYTLNAGKKVAVYSWYGGEVSLGGAITTAYESNETQMPLYANLHQRLEGKREEARASNISGPRVIIVGPTDSGKSTLCRILTSYACRVGRCPTIVDLDLGQGEISIPGTVAATPIDRACLSVEEGYIQTTPLAYYYGHVSAGDTIPVYKNYVQRLADTLNRRMTVDADARVAGILINTMGWVEGAGYSVLLDVIRVMQADVVVVMGQDRLFAQLSEDVKKVEYVGGAASSSSSTATSTSAAAAATASSVAISGAGAGGEGGAGGANATENGGSVDAAALSTASTTTSSTTTSLAGLPSSQPSAAVTAILPIGKPVSILKLPRSGGVVIREPPQRKLARKARFKEYFYGVEKGPGIPASLSPEVITVKFEDITVVRVGGMTSEASLVPVGKTSALEPLRVTHVLPSQSLLNHVLGVSFATSDKQVPHVNVCGFVHVRKVSMETKTLTLLVPCAGTLPSKFLIMGSNTWVET